jgi:hypothetical protein
MDEVLEKINTDHHRRLQYVLRWISSFYVIATVSLCVYIPDLWTQLALVAASFALFICFYFIRIGQLQLVRYILGYGSPSFFLAVMALHKYWTSLEFSNLVHSFVTGIFLQFAMIIPVLIYPSRGRLYWSNSIFILLLIMVISSINGLLYPISAIGDQVKAYYLFDALLVITSSFFLLYSYSKYKAIHAQKEENKTVKKFISVETTIRYLINAIKYAEATIIRVEVANNLNFIDRKIRDDGIGFKSLSLDDCTRFRIE